MKLKSLIENANRLEVAEVEIEFIPGIPQIHFLGLPDRIIKESFYRIKSALKSSGYKFPLTSQMIVNIKPNHLRKSSRGVELAVALGILMKTQQIEEGIIKPDWVIYGELGLDGNIYEPTDLNQSLYDLQDCEILTGAEVQIRDSIQTDLYRLESLKNIEINLSKKNKKYKRPSENIKQCFSTDEAEFLFLASVTGLHGLLAGEAGAGKSTLARALVGFLPAPEEGEYVRENKHWRPAVSPHQSITPAAFLGGGAQIYEGEVERVQGGVLILDELLEFDPEILESLRGPMTGENLRLARGAQYREISCRFQVMATTNLCPCGKWSPLKNNINCRFSRTKCTRYLEKFSGPLLDRFGLLLFSKNSSERKISGEKILARIERFRNENVELAKLKVTPVLWAYFSQVASRRCSYLERVAAVYAVEESLGCEKNQLIIDLKHLNKAEKWVLRPFEQLEKGMG